MQSLAVVAGQSAFQIQIRGRPSYDVRRTTITITADDDRREWTNQVAGWRPMAVRWGCGQPYLWSARTFVVPGLLARTRASWPSIHMPVSEDLADQARNLVSKDMDRH